MLFHLPEGVARLAGGGDASVLLLAFFPAAWWLARTWHPAGVRGAYALEGGAAAWQSLAWLFVLAIAAKGAALATGYALGIYDRGIPNPSVQGDAPFLLIAVTAAVQLAGLALFTFVPSLAEDVLTRGLLLRWPRVRWTGPTFVAASTTIYVLNHVWRLGAGPWEWSMLAAFGVAYGAASWRRGTLWAAVGLHWGWNFAGPFLNGVAALEAVDADRARLVSAAAHLVLAAIVLGWPKPRRSPG